MNDFLFGHVEEEAVEDRIVWSTEKIEQLTHALAEGTKIKVTLPFYEGNMKFRRANVVFDYTDHELGEIRKCAKDIVYFAENYACVMTDNGIQRIKLRDYQIDMLRQFASNRFNITLASRQIGKCTLGTTRILIKISDPIILSSLNSMLHTNHMLNSEFSIMLFQLHYFMNNNNYTMLDRIKYKLYRILTYLS